MFVSFSPPSLFQLHHPSFSVMGLSILFSLFFFFFLFWVTFTFLLPFSLPLCSSYHYSLSSPPLTLLSIITSSSLCHYQISACVSGRNTWSTNRHYATASPRTSGSHWSGSLSCSVKRVRCCVPETWDPSSATSSSRSWPTSRLSGVTTWAELCWRPWREYSSRTLWGTQRAPKACACWSVWTKTTTRRAEGCWELRKWCHPVMMGTQRLTGIHKLIRLSGVYYIKLKEEKREECN